MERIAGIVRFGGGGGDDAVPQAAAELGAALSRHGRGSLVLLSSKEAALLRFSTLDQDQSSPRGVATLGQCRIVADLRIDNRAEVARGIGIAPLPPERDAELVLSAYLHWGASIAERLLGDFVYAIHDERTRSLHLARDATAARVVYYCDSIPDTLVFGSSATVVLASSLVPPEFNEARIADFIVGDLEGHDPGCSFFAHIKRLPPGTRLTRDALGNTSTCADFTCAAAMPEADARSPHEQFIEIFSQSIRDRLLDGGRVGSMLSGGLDSSAIAALAANVQQDPRETFPTFSAVDPGSAACMETRAIRAMQATGRFDFRSVDCASPKAVTARFEAALAAMEDPFDSHSMLIHSVFDLAAAHGCDALCDGINADAMFGKRLPPVWSMAGLRRRASNVLHPRLRAMARRSLESLGWNGDRALAQKNLVAVLLRSGLRPAFARQVRLDERLDGMARDLRRRSPVHRHPYTVAAVERYGRIASTFGCNALHPFNDLRVIALLADLPPLLTSAANKDFLRRAVTGKLPETVRLRADKGHLGRVFRATVRRACAARVDANPISELAPALQKIFEPEYLATLTKPDGSAGLTPTSATWEARRESLNTINVWKRRVDHALRSRSCAFLAFDQELDHGTPI